MNIIEAANIVSDCVSKGDMVQVLSYICIDKNNIMAYNGKQAMIANIDKCDISCAVPGELFVKIANSLPNVELSMKDKTLLMSHKKTKAKISTLKRKEFIFDIDTENKDYSTTSIKEDFIEGLSKCLDTVDTNEANIANTGITLDTSKKKSVLYSSDRNQLSKYVLTKTKIKEETKLMLPKEFCQLIISNKDRLKDAKLKLYVDMVEISAKDLSIYTHLIPNLSFLDFEGTVSLYHSSDLKYIKVTPKLIEALDRCLIPFYNVTNKIIHISCDNEELLLASKSSVSHVKERIRIKDRVKSFDIDVNGLYLKSMLSGVTKLAVANNYAIVGADEEGNFIRMFSRYNSSSYESTKDLEETE